MTSLCIFEKNSIPAWQVEYIAMNSLFLGHYMRKWRKTQKPDKIVSFVEIYVDTNDYDLIKNGFWLRYRIDLPYRDNEQFSLKIVDTLNTTPFTYYETGDKAEILQKLQILEKIDQKSYSYLIDDGTKHPNTKLNVFETRRLYLHKDNISQIYIDQTVLIHHAYYVCGFKRKIGEKLSSNTQYLWRNIRTQTAPCKLIAFLFHFPDCSPDCSPMSISKGMHQPNKILQKYYNIPLQLLEYMHPELLGTKGAVISSALVAECVKHVARRKRKYKHYT